MNDKITVNLSNDRSYQINIGYDNLKILVDFLKENYSISKIAIITDTNVEGLYLNQISDLLQKNKFDNFKMVIPAGESSKSFDYFVEITDNLIKNKIQRGDLIIALGGGVIGDLAGLVASIFYRGVPLVQIPTTVVSQVDSSVGGKTGVNTPEGKNLIGSFYHPRLVISDTLTLKSLPQREFNEGFAEVIKHAAIRDESMFQSIMNVDGPENLEDLIIKNVEIKRSIVEADEKELSGLRAHLNYGHTIGHAIEAAGSYGHLLHGEAISLGIIAANKISSKVFNFPDKQENQIMDALRKFDLPTVLAPSISTDDILSIMKTDKKFKNGKIRFVVLHKLGQAELIESITEDDIKTAIESLRS